MAATLPIESYNGGVRAAGGITTDMEADLNGMVVTTAGNVTIPGTLAVTGAVTGPSIRTITDSALVGATVALTAAQSGGVFNNRSTSGTPSWTLPTAANGLYYTFTVSDVTTGFTVTGGTMKAKTNAAGTTLSGTTLTNTQGTAVVNDTITLVCDGTVWRMVAQSGIFALA